VTGQFFKKMGAIAATALALLPTMASAQEIGAVGRGHPEPGQFHLQESVTPIMDSIVAFHDGILMWTISLIVLLVLALLVVIVVRFNAKANPVPARFTHNTLVEIIWTVVPILVLVVIAIPSFGVLSDQMTIPDGERKYLGANVFSMGEVDVPAPTLTVKASGEQWYWNYEYVDQGVAFDSNMLNDDEIAALKFYGQCSELCGKDHAFMPIGVRVVSVEEFETFIAAFEESRDYATAVAVLPAL
jgi:cytochrome c oxidase subunit 2